MAGVRDIPIIFSAPMVRALLDGRKTMTRRLAISAKVRDNWGMRTLVTNPSPWQKVQPGDRLWVRENWCRFPENAPDGMGACDYYMADRKGSRLEAEVMKRNGVKWIPSIHMPRDVSRLTLVVTATKIERLVQISEADAEAEGAARDHSVKWAAGDPGCVQDVYRRNFAALWRSLHGEQSWDANPEVVAISFTVHQCNIDQMKDAA